MAIIYQKDKRSGITYVYESKSHWDKVKKQSRAKRTLLGRLDEFKGEIVPTDGRMKIHQIERNEADGKVTNNHYFLGISREKYSMNLSAFEIMGISSRIIKNIKSRGYETIGDLANLNEIEYMLAVRKRNIKSFDTVIYKFKMTIEKLIKEVLRETEESRKYKVYLARAGGQSFEAIGEQFGTSKQRSAQIVEAFHDEIKEFIYCVLEKYLSEKKYIRIDDDFKELCKIESFKELLVFFCAYDKKYEYLDFSEIILHKQEKSVEEELSMILQEVIGEGIDINENWNAFELAISNAGLGFIAKKDVYAFLKKESYYFYNDFVSKYALPYGVLCEKIVSEYFPKGIKITRTVGKIEEDITRLRALVSKKYGDLGLPESDKSLTERMGVHLVQCDRGKFISRDKIIIEDSTLDKITAYIDQCTEEKIYFSEIFNKFEELLNRTSNVDNEYFLHGVLRWKFPDEYKMSRDYIVNEKGQK